MTLAFIPLTTVGMPIEDLQLFWFWVTLLFVAIMPSLNAAFVWSGPRDDGGFRRWQIWLLPAVYACYLAMLVCWVQPFGQLRLGAAELPSAAV